jgi:protein Tob/BTG
MQFEVSVALNFMIAYLYNKLPRRYVCVYIQKIFNLVLIVFFSRVNMFGEQMIKHIRIKFQGHWYPERPTKGSAYRSIRISKEKVDRVIINAAIDVGLDLQEILDTLPNDLTIWIDPGEVSYRIGEKGSGIFIFVFHEIYI